MKNFLKKTLIVVFLSLFTLGLFAKGAKKNKTSSKSSISEHNFESSFISTTKIEYPIFENEPVLNEFIYETVKKIQEDFNSETQTKAGEKAALDFYINYKNINQNNEYISFLLRCYTYKTGENHGITTLLPINYSVSEKRIISLEDFFKPYSNEILEKLSSEAEKQLMVLLKKRKLVSTEEQIKEGTAPSIENFKNFEILDKKIKIIFEQYQVAPYSSGMPEITIPLSLFE